MHFIIRLGIPSINRPKFSGEMFDQAIFICFSSIFKSFEPPLESRSSFKMDQRFSIGLRSGEFAGHVALAQKLVTFFLSQSCVIFALCAGHHPVEILLRTSFVTFSFVKRSPFPVFY